MKSKWIAASTSDDAPMKRGGMRRIASMHKEPDADDRGGPSDNDADDMNRRKKKMKPGGMMPPMNDGMGY